MKIFSKAQIYLGDQTTAERQNISSTDLMERAGTQIFNWIHMRMQGAQVPIHVFCGIGNNGGDGLVLARHLITHGYNVHTYITNFSDKRSKDFLVNYDRIKNVTKSWPVLLTCEADFPQIQPEDVIVDAVFGIGLNKPIESWVKSLFQHFRASKAFTLAIDIPSGLHTDQPVTDEDAVVWAGYTLSFASPKLVFFLPETAKFTVQWEVLDIGLDPEFLSATQTEVALIGKHDVLPNYMPREKFSHKGQFGHALIIGGSYGKIGAVTLASKAALAAGAGLVSAFIPRCGYIPLQTAVPEAMVETDINEAMLTAIDFNTKPTVIGCGMGMGTAIETVKAFKTFLEFNKSSLVIDADALNILAADKQLLELVPELSILTPHPKELERLIGAWTDDFDKLEKAKAFAKQFGIILVIKGANSITIYNEKLFVNTTGNPGLATAGSGDVLTGIITGLIAQGYHPSTAAIFGVYLHGKSADIAVEDFGYQSLMSSHVIEYLGKAYLNLFERPEQAEVTPAETSEAEAENAQV
jgi:hydroxyethylthiazole kinase-like uncharacterized protein yjeF